jgi:hypothetical protein
VAEFRALRPADGRNPLVLPLSSMANRAHSGRGHLPVYALMLGTGKRVSEGVHATFRLTSAAPYPTGVVGLHYVRQR